jgi:hypothetical protein
MMCDGTNDLLIIPGGQAKNNYPNDEDETRWMMMGLMICFLTPGGKAKNN